MEIKYRGIAAYCKGALNTKLLKITRVYSDGNDLAKVLETCLINLDKTYFDTSSVSEGLTAYKVFLNI